MTGITIFYGDTIILYVVNTKQGLRLYFKQLPDNYQAKFALNLMSKLSNFIINKPFSAINNAARHIFSRYLLEDVYKRQAKPCVGVQLIAGINIYLHEK